jgi:tetratricopeptide (TPR) repeat protein
MRLDLAQIDPERATVFFGAGVTSDAGGPTANQLIVEIASHLVRDSKWRDWIEKNVQPTGALRFETVMDELHYVFDPKLRVLRFFNLLTPGPLHNALARAAAQGARLITVNFDNLAERALAGVHIAPWTVDLQRLEHSDRIMEFGAVLKLHGTLLINEGAADAVAAKAPLHATISRIVKAGGGAGLPAHVEAFLRKAVNGRVLVIIGYSGSDDIDVMPSLRHCRPAEVLWVQHGNEAPVIQSFSTIPAIQRLIDEWKSNGATITIVSGLTRAVFTAIGWHLTDDLGANYTNTARASWRNYVKQWAGEVAHHDPSGLGWVAQLPSSLGLFDEAHDALMDSVPSQHSGYWNTQRRMQALAENAYLRGVDYNEVRALAEQARLAAVDDDDVVGIATSYHLIARTYLNDYPEDLAATEEALRRAREALRATGEEAIEADLKLLDARLLIAQGKYGDAANVAANAAEEYQRAGEFALVSEAMQVSGHALSLDWRNDEAMGRLQEASRIASLGPYPDRQIDCELVLAMISDGMGDTDLVIKHASSAIAVAQRANHLNEISQSFLLLGLALSENGSFAEAAVAFENGLAAINATNEHCRNQLACGLAESLVHIGETSRAVEVLKSNEWSIVRNPLRKFHSTAIRWRAGAATENEVLAAAQALNSEDIVPDGQVAFAIIRLGVPGEAAKRFFSRARSLAAEGGQVQTVKRLDAALTVYHTDQNGIGGVIPST